jgi:hypothetical protein
MIVDVLGCVPRGWQGGERGIRQLRSRLLHHHKLLLVLGEVVRVRAGSTFSVHSCPEALQMLLLPGENLWALVHGLLEFWLAQIVGLAGLLHMRVNVQDLLLFMR